MATYCAALSRRNCLTLLRCGKKGRGRLDPEPARHFTFKQTQRLAAKAAFSTFKPHSGLGDRIRRVYRLHSPIQVLGTLRAIIPGG
jgi:hypothetical protein